MTTDAAGAGGEAEGGAGGAVELVCEIYPFEECLDGLSNESYSCCPVTGGPCVVGFRTSEQDFPCGEESCLCAADNFYAACHGAGDPCEVERDCETIWEYDHVDSGEYPDAPFSLQLIAQLDVDAPACGTTVGIGVDHGRVGSFMVPGATPCWKTGPEVTSSVILPTEAGDLESVVPPQTPPAFDTNNVHLELDVFQLWWDADSIVIDVTWRLVGCNN